MFITSISNEELNKLDYAAFPGKIYVIDSVGAEFNRAIAYLRSQKVIGFDTETRPCFSPNQPRYGVSLLQLSGPEKAFLFRIKNFGMHRRLCNLLAVPDRRCKTAKRLPCECGIKTNCTKWSDCNHTKISGKAY